VCPCAGGRTIAAGGGAVLEEPILVVNPASDWQLVTTAHELLRQGASSPAVLEAGLRLHYPEVVVRPRELSNESRKIWYIYREGHWIPPVPTDDTGLQLGVIVDVRD
jgi:hypothetical protein